ncbi:hypothetical protein [Pantoea sp. At-9b]|jgi:hypothetical protein|uniref:hypothetical protein n=1 Tax=Pantoea sp. (strain At-9b) TaxID=592316 RepID=UPI0001B3FDE4|nr:hypothetical protein [Pantoea sp. At-9b]
MPDREKAALIVSAVGRVVPGLRLTGQKIAEYTINEKPEEFRTDETDPAEKDVYRKVAEVIITGEMMF